MEEATEGYGVSTRALTAANAGAKNRIEGRRVLEEHAAAVVGVPGARGEPAPPRLALIREQAARVVALEAENAALVKTMQMLTKHVATLERLLGSGGHGGGRDTPPPTRPPSGRPRGGQHGRKGTRASRALAPRSAVIDEARV